MTFRKDIESTSLGDGESYRKRSLCKADDDISVGYVDRFTCQGYLLINRDIRTLSTVHHFRDTCHLCQVRFIKSGGFRWVVSSGLADI